MTPELFGWRFAPEGAALRVDEKTAIIADVHLGYEWARARGGDSVPPHSLAETIAKLATLFDRESITRLIVAGDLVESLRACPRTAKDLRDLKIWISGRNVELTWLRGNHDPTHRPALATSCQIGGWTIAHGDRVLSRGPAVFGHHHPVLRADGLTAPCFLVGSKTLALPAFSPNAAGLDVCGPLPTPFLREPLRCVAALGSTVLDFGLLEDLRAKIRPSPMGL